MADDDSSAEHDDAAAAGMLLALDVDCGEVVPGRRLRVRGLRDEGRWPDRLRNRLPVAGDWQMVSLDYDLVPPVHRDHPDAPAWYQHDVAEVTYEVDPPLTWDLATAGGVGGGTGGEASGQPSSHGTYGPYPLPSGARRVVFTVFPHLDRRPGGEASGDVVVGSQEPAGRVVVDLGAGAGRWEPVTPAR